MKHIYYTLAVAALALTACHSKSDKDATAQQAPAIDVAQVVVDTVTLHTVYPGFLTADQEVELVARVNGYLTSKPYKAGSFVKAGTVLYTIESRNYSDAVNEARARLADAQSSYAYNSKNYAAMQRALQSDAVSQMEVLQSKNAMEAAQASIDQAKAALQQAQTTLSYCTVRAPFDGHVTVSNYDVGAYLAGGAAPVVLGKIYADRTMLANFSIDANALARIEANSKNPALGIDLKHIPVIFDNELPHNYFANLDYMAPALDKSTGTMRLQALIDNSYGDLRSGMYCKIKLPDAIVPNAIMVKDASIGTDQSGKFVYVVNDSNKVVSRAITVSELVNDTMRVVTKGLKPGDRYVTKALLKVRDGMTIKPITVK